MTLVNPRKNYISSLKRMLVKKEIEAKNYISIFKKIYDSGENGICVLELAEIFEGKLTKDEIYRRLQVLKGMNVVKETGYRPKGTGKMPHWSPAFKTPREYKDEIDEFLKRPDVQEKSII